MHKNQPFYLIQNTAIKKSIKTIDLLILLAYNSLEHNNNIK